MIHMFMIEGMFMTAVEAPSLPLAVHEFIRTMEVRCNDLPVVPIIHPGPPTVIMYDDQLVTYEGTAP